MSAHTSYDRATVALGAASLASLGSLALSGDLRFAVVEGPAIGVAVVLGVLAVVAGLAAVPWLAVAVGVAFVAAAVLQVVLVALRETLLGGNTSTSALWLGLGVGLLALSPARRRTADAARHQAPSKEEDT